MAGWPEHIVEQFGTVTPLGEVDETEYYGPYNGLLLDQFPGPEHFMIVPQYKRPTYPQSIDFTTIFIVQRHKHPIFFIDIKPAGHIQLISIVRQPIKRRESGSKRSPINLQSQYSMASVIWGLIFVSTLMTRRLQFSTPSALMRIQRESMTEPLPTAGILTS